MPHIRHVIAYGIRISLIPYGERIIGRVPLLGKLQTLSTLENSRFTRDVVEMIPSLKKLKVVYTYRHHGEVWQEFCLNNLVLLSELETLDIKFYTSYSYPRPLPESFAFPQNLKKLTLRGCALPWKDMRVVGLLPNLQVLKLAHYAFMGEEWETIQELFPRLKFLLMEDLDLKYWRAESTHFPTLEHLEIRYCLSLEEIPPEIGEIPTLELIEVYGSRLAADSAKKIQREQRDLGNDALKVRIYDY